MSKTRDFLRAWGPALLVMVLIFFISSRPSSALPNFSWADSLIKKGGHVLGYGLLALAYWRGFGLRAGKQPVAWLLALAYAVTDEIHQSFVPGRHPSPVDVVLFDNLGALLALLVYTYYHQRTRSRKPGDS
jgi:VanZ family protein